ncbi:MAG: T9SS type A sorting domain-containing protein [Mariniphaga sp.]
MKRQIFRLLVLIVPVFIQYTSFSQGVIKAESGARIVSQTGSYWVVDNGAFTFTSTNATNPVTMDNLKIEAEASLQLPTTTCLTVNGTLTNDAGTTGLVIKSDATSTGSLKILGNVSGAAIVERYMTPDAWHLISSPTSSQPIINFLNNNTDIATAGNTYPYTFAMKNYNSSGTGWITDYFTSGKAIGDLFGPGKGYLVRTVGPEVTKILQFEGQLNALPIGNNVPVISGWNLVGNPFTSAISINYAAGNASGGTNFIDENSDVLKGSFAAVYLWDETAFPKGYIVVNHSHNSSSPFYAQVGQGFFVKAVAGNLKFTSSMQVHQGGAIFKGTKVPTPQIKLIAESNVGSTSTIIEFIEGTTARLDVGYDAGVFKAEPSFALYTRLVEDNGVDFQLQCLPPTGYDKLVIPIGIDSKAASEIVFSVQAVQLDPNCKVILEDRLTDTFTDLSKGNYKAAVAANTAGTGRFFIHTGDIISGVDDQVLPGKLTAYAVRNVEIRVVGEVGEGAVATLYNGLGQVVLTKKLSAGNLNIIGLQNLSSGVYLLKIDNNGTPQTFKVMVRK